MDGIRAWGAPEPAALAAFYRRSELEILSRRISYCAWSAWLVYFICIDLSYPVFAQLRGDSSRRAEFLLQHILTVGAQVLPLVLFFTGIEIWNYSARLAVLVFAMAYLTRIGCLRWQVKITQMLPQPLTTGELRDRVFALARKAGVKIQQVFVMPAGKGAMANAFAARNNMVIFTDYLLQRLTNTG